MFIFFKNSNFIALFIQEINKVDNIKYQKRDREQNARNHVNYIVMRYDFMNRRSTISETGGEFSLSSRFYDMTVK